LVIKIKLVTVRRTTTYPVFWRQVFQNSNHSPDTETQFVDVALTVQKHVVVVVVVVAAADAVVVIIIIIIFIVVVIIIFNRNIKDWTSVILSVSRFTAFLANVSSVFQLFSFLVVCCGTISTGFGFVAFFASVNASSVCIHLSCLICL